MKRTSNNNRKRQNNNKNNSGLTRMNKQINLHNRSEGTTFQVGYPTIVYFDSSSLTYTFVNASDVRYLSFNTILNTNPYPFTDLALVYEEYKISAASAIVTAIDLSSSTYSYLGPLFLTADPELPPTSTNPTNLTVLSSQTTKIFSHKETDPRSVKYTFPGVGIGANIWSSVTTTPMGNFFIGQDQVDAPGNIPAFSVILTLTVHFRSIRSH